MSQIITAKTLKLVPFTIKNYELLTKYFHYVSILPFIKVEKNVYYF